jgi:short-subunit dehydrogenase
LGIDVRDSVIVVTGASSGIGRATAIKLARQGVTVALVARGSTDLNEAAAECGRTGAEAMPVAGDMGDENQVKDVADRVLTRYGRIDGWINNAGIHLVGRIEEVPMEAIRRVVATNLLGYIHGARAAIPIFREQGRGVLINVASLSACVGQPYASAYVASKWAVRGLSECLRMELADVPDIAVCTLLPGFTDTPLFQHAGNYTGRAVKPAGAPLAAAEVADAIIDLLGHPQRERFLGVPGALIQVAKLLAPGLVEWKLTERSEREHFSDLPAGRSEGNLFHARPGAISGGWQRRRPQRRRALTIGTVALATLAALPLGYMAWRQIQQRV